MEVLYPRCAGVDVHAGSVTACVRIASGADITYQHRAVAATTQGLLELAEWFAASGCTHVAIAYASHCTSLGRCETFSSAARLFDSLTPLAFCGGLGPGSSYRYSSLSLHR
jgi:hypothetical protein